MARKAFGIAFAIALLGFCFTALPASAQYVHTTVTGEYGIEGSNGGGIGDGCQIAYQSATHRLYLYSDEQIYGLNVTSPGIAVKAGEKFPAAAGAGRPSSFCEGNIAVDNSSTSSAGNIYQVPNQDRSFGFKPTGEALGSPWPLETIVGGFPIDTSGAAVANNGTVWFGGQRTVQKYTPAGSSAGSLELSGGFGFVGRIALDQTNNDLFADEPFGGGLTKYTAASGYKTAIPLPNVLTNSRPELAVNGAKNRLYVLAGGGGYTTSEVNVYDTDTGELIETVLAGQTARGIAVDEATDTLFIAVGQGASGYIEERPGVIVPDVTVSEPTDFATLHGHIELAGGGDVTGCVFEYSTNPEFNGAASVPCSPGPDYTSDQDVTADLTGLVTEETEYFVRLKASNAKGTNRSAYLSFVPHFVAGLRTDPASGLEREGATLNASYLGNGEETNVHFNWGLTDAYGHSTPVQDIPGSATHTSVSAALSNVLKAGTEYHYQVVASNGKGLSEARDATFVTKPAVSGVSTEPATNVTTTSADLNGSFEADGIDVKYWFEYGSSLSYGTKTSVTELTAPTGTIVSPPVNISELQPLHTYHFRLVAENSFGVTKGADHTFTMVSTPGIAALSSSHVTATTADLHATINPHSSATTYRFEYGPNTFYGTKVPIPDGSLPAVEAGEEVQVHLTGLTGGVYHFRVVASNEFGNSVSSDQIFNFYPPECPNSTVRQQTGSNGLPDCRAYELVSPGNAGITSIFPASLPFSPTASAPSRLAYIGAFGAIKGIGEPMNLVGDTYVATRTTSGWKSRYVGLPSSERLISAGPPWDHTVPGVPPGQVGAWEPDRWSVNEVMDPSLGTLVAWDNGHIAETETVDGPYYQGASNAPYVWNTNNGAQLDRWPTNVESIPGGEFFRGQTYVSPNLGHYVFTSDIPFAPGGKPGDMYDNDIAAASIEIINFDEDGNRIAAQPVTTSQDGSHVLMTVGGAKEPGDYYLTSGPGELFMRVGAETIDIAPGKAVKFVSMTPDGETVYFTSSQDLTEDHSDTDTSRDLYMWSESGSLPGHIVEVSKGNDTSSGDSDGCSATWTERCDVKPLSFVREYSLVQGGAGGGPYSDSAMAANGDIYFLSPEKLDGSNGLSDAENLYRFDGTKLHFVAELEPSAVSCLKNQGATHCSETAVARMEVTPDGKFMAFITGSSHVTSYDSEGHSEMYRYTAPGGELICVSCPASGAPPTQNVLGSHNGRFIADDGRTFFETADGVIPQDTNEAPDVYEYAGGKPQLVTSGTAAANETFGIATNTSIPGLIGVSANGADVYFATYDVLVGQDENGEALKIYDARSGGGFPFTPPVPPCVAADECHGPSSTAPPATINATGGDLGAGSNLVPAKKNAKKKHSRKKSQKRAKHHAKRRQKGGPNG